MTRRSGMLHIVAAVISGFAAVIWSVNTYRALMTADSLSRFGVTDRQFLYTPVVLDGTGAILSVVCLVWALRASTARWTLLAALVLLIPSLLFMAVTSAARGG